MKNLIYSIIKNRQQYDLYCEKLEELTENGSQSFDEIELLSYLIQKYNDEETEKYLINLNPVELLIDLLRENKISQVELSRKIQVSPQLINDIIKYRREISKRIAIKLSEEFSLNYYAFLKPYKLQKASNR